MSTHDFLRGLYYAKNMVRSIRETHRHKRKVALGFEHACAEIDQAIDGAISATIDNMNPEELIEERPAVNDR